MRKRLNLPGVTRRVEIQETTGVNHQMAKIIEKGSVTGKEPWFSTGWTIGPVRIYKPSTKGGKPESKEEKPPNNSPPPVEEAAKLPSGTHFLDPQDNRRVRP